jgi:hypothetical protein
MLVELVAGAPPEAVGGLSQALTSGGGSGPQILHYLWPLDVTAVCPPKVGASTLLLTTVYDEDFADYISDLVTANPALFNMAAHAIVGLQDLIPVESAENLPKFIEFVREHDLTKGGTAPGFWQAYDANVVTILANLPPSS